MATAIAARGPVPLRYDQVFSITGVFRFHPGAHGNHPLDVESFLKPTFDALAAGLSCSNGTLPESIDRPISTTPDSFVHWLPDVRAVESEGAVLDLGHCAT